MAQIEAWLWDRLKTDADILAALGGPKVYPFFAPQLLAVPYITFSRTATERRYTTRRNDGLPTATFEVNCWDRRYANLLTWKEFVRRSLDGFQGDVDTFQVRMTKIMNESDELFELDTGSELGIYVASFVVDVMHTEEVAENIQA